MLWFLIIFYYLDCTKCKFPDFSQYSFFSLTFNKIPWLFPDFCQVWNFPDFSLTTGHPVHSKSQYSPQIFICFIAYIFQFLKSSLEGVGVLQLWDGPVAFHHCYYDQNGPPAKDNEISQHPLLGGQAQGFCWEDQTGSIVMELAKLTVKMDKIHNHVKIFNPGIKWKESLFVSVSTFTAFHSSCQSDASSLSATR